MYRVAFFGTPEFSVSTLKTIHEHPDFDISLVVTMPDRPSGRGKKLKAPPVAEYAKEHGLDLVQTPNINKDPEALEILANSKADLFVVIAFAQFLGTKVLSLPALGAFNVHTSLLPKYRGAAPIQYALLKGDKVTGVSIQKMVKKMDAGDIVYSHEVPISKEETSQSLFQKLEIEAAKGMEQFLDLFKNQDGQIEGKPQTESEATFAPTIQKGDGLINPFKFSAQELLNRFKAFYPWPGVFLYLNDFRLKVTELELFPKNLETGVVDTSLGSLLLGTKEGTIRLTKVQPEGKKPVSDKDFLNGIKNKIDSLELNKDHYE